MRYLNAKWVRILTEEPPAIDVVRHMRNAFIYANALNFVPVKEFEERIAYGIGKRREICAKFNAYTGSTLTFSNLRALFSAHSLCHRRAIPVSLFGMQFEMFPFSRVHMRNNTGVLRLLLFKTPETCLQN